MSGRMRRLRRLFRHGDGRAILTPIDHGLWYGPMSGIESPCDVARRVMAGSDGLLIAPGFARHITDIFPSDRALVMRVGASTALSPVQDYEALFLDMETAVRLDADALAHTLYMGGERDDQAIRDLGTVISSAGHYDIPVIAEFLPSQESCSWQEVAHWARLGFEMGADVIKTVYTGDPESFRKVVVGCPIPILIAGGPAVGTASDLLATVAAAIEAGVAGTAIGRRVWQDVDPAGLLDLFGQLIHERVTLDQALAALDAPVRASS